MPDVDVIVTTYERPRALARCLMALLHQTEPPHRVIVVDDCSPTPACGAAAAAVMAGLNVHVIRCDRNGGPARGRNRGVESATSDIVLFVDDDVVADTHLVERHAAAHELANGAFAAIGPLRAPADWHPTPWNYWESATLEFQYQRMERGDYAPTWRQFFTGNASVSRTAFLEAGGFDESLRRAEDVELALRMSLNGCRFEFLPRATGWHYAHRTRASWLAIPRQYAEVDVLMDRLHPELRWLNVVEGELRRRHALTRAAIRLPAPRRSRSTAISAAIAAAETMFRTGRRGASNALLSLVYSIEYADALAEAKATRPATQQHFNGASTGADDDSPMAETAVAQRAE